MSAASLARRPCAVLALVVALLCVVAPAALAQDFTDVTDTAGLGGPHGAIPPWDNLQSLFSGGIAVGDYDGDNLPDIFWTGGTQQPCRLFQNQGDGTYIDRAFTAGVAYQIPSNGALFFDADDDGDLDLHVTTYENVHAAKFHNLAGPGPINFLGVGTDNVLGDPPPDSVVTYRNVFFRNNGDGTFSDVTEAAGLARSGRFGAAAGDVDGDGILDLVTATWSGEHNRLFHNDGTGRFRDFTPANIAADDVWGFTPTVLDFDDDGDGDLFFANDVVTSRLYRNEGGMLFTDITDVSNLGVDENGMGSALGDIDNDGDADWFVTAIYSPFELGTFAYNEEGNQLYLNDGAGSFTEVTDPSGINEGGWGWGAQFADLDHDADLDIVQANGWTEPGIELKPELHQFLDDTLRLWINDGAGVFTDGAAGMNLVDTDQGRGLVVFDHNADGALDILVANYGTGLTLYEGDPGALTGTWLAIELRGTTSNHFGVGAKITVTARGLPDQTRWITCGNNYLSQAPMEAWFGMAGASSCDVTVRWPDGSISQHDGIATGQRVVITQP